MGEEVARLSEDAAVAAALGAPPAVADARATAPRADAALADAVEAEPIGAFLSRQRRLRGIGLDELARITCIPLRSLERLESGAFDATPDGFARGFVRTVASALGLDPDDAVSRMLPEARPGSRPRTPPFVEPSPWLRMILAVLGLAALVVMVVEKHARPSEPSEIQSQRVYRRDAVRELAREQGLMPPRDSTDISALPGATAPAP